MIRSRTISTLAPTSIIIPLVASDSVAVSQFDDTLASVLRNRTPNCQIIVAHDGSYRDPYGLNDEVEFVSTQRAPHLIRLLNCGLRVATGQFIATIRPGVELTDGWHEIVVAAFGDSKIASVSPALQCPNDPNKMVTAGVETNFGFNRLLCGEGARMAKSSAKRISPIGPTSWAGFYRRDALDELGSFDETLDPHYVDLDVALGLRSLGYRCAFRPECLAMVSLPKRITRESQLPHGRSSQRAMRRHSNGMNPILRGALAFAVDVVATPVRPWGLQHGLQRVGAWRTADIDRHYHQQLDQTLRQRKRDNQRVLPFKARPDQVEPGVNRRAA